MNKCVQYKVNELPLSSKTFNHYILVFIIFRQPTISAFNSFNIMIKAIIFQFSSFLDYKYDNDVLCDPDPTTLVNLIC